MLIGIGLLVSVVMVATPSPDVEYNVVDLGTLGGGRAVARDGNGVGEIVGHARDASQAWHAFLWTAQAGMTTLDLGGDPAWAYGISDDGVIAGDFQRPEGGLQAVSWTEAGGAVSLPGLGGGQSAALGISSSGIIVGDAVLPSGETYATLWDADGAIHNLGTFPDGVSSSAHAVNAGGITTGSAHYAVPGGSPYAHASIWNANGEIEDLGTLGGLESFGLGINGSSWIVGYSNSSSTHYDPFVWTPDNGMSEIPIPPEFDTGPCYAMDINDDGVVAGYVSGAVTRAFLWSEASGTIVLEGFGYTTMAWGINDLGWVLGEAGVGDGTNHAVAWIPIPEPATCVLLFSAMLVWRRNRNR